MLRYVPVWLVTVTNRLGVVMVLRTQPYVCATCGKQSESRGIPILRLDGVIESYVMPYNWGHVGDDVACSDCLVRRASELDDYTAHAIADTLEEMLTESRGHRSIKLRAAEILYMRMRTSKEG